MKIRCLNRDLIKLFGKICLICCCCWLFGCQTAVPSTITASVKRIVSGQTIEVWLTQTDKSATKETVRIVGINAPDLQQSPWGKAARQKLEQIISPMLSSSIQLEIEGRDRFNRYLAHVWHDGNLISEQLVKGGYVLADTDYPNQYSQRIWYAQEYARLMGYGIWNPQQPMQESPEQFRFQNNK